MKDALYNSNWTIVLITGFCNLLATVHGLVYGLMAIAPGLSAEEFRFLFHWAASAFILSYSGVPIYGYYALRSVNRFIGADKEGAKTDAALREEARRKTLNLPVLFTRVSTWVWTGIALSYIPIHQFAFPGHSILTAAHIALATILVGSVSGTFVYYGSEWFCRRRLIPRLFPEGDLSTVRGVRPVPISFKILILIINICVLPVGILSIAALSGKISPAVVLYLGITFLGIGGLQGIAIARSLSEPIREVVNEMGRVREGDFAARARVLSLDDVGALSEGFNAMVKGLQRGEIIRETFGRYVSKDVLDRVLKGDIDVSGEIRSATVLFSDIRDFTAITETLPPVELLTHLNSYLDIMVDAVIDNGGRVDKFIGDAVMAVFGVPVAQPDHALQAVNAALDMLKRLEAWNAELASNGLTPWKIGIGLHSGEVIAGNIGSAKKMEYAVIGEVVNTASRIEQLNKEFRTTFLISEDTFRLVKEHVDAVQREPVMVKGISRPLTVYSVEGRKK